MMNCWNPRGTSESVSHCAPNSHPSQDPFPDARAAGPGSHDAVVRRAPAPGPEPHDAVVRRGPAPGPGSHDDAVVPSAYDLGPGPQGAGVPRARAPGASGGGQELISGNHVATLDRSGTRHDRRRLPVPYRCALDGKYNPPGSRRRWRRAGKQAACDTPEEVLSLILASSRRGGRGRMATGDGNAVEVGKGGRFSLPSPRSGHRR